MKKILSIIGIMLVLTGCSLGMEDLDNTPTKQVEAYLNSYQKLDDNVLNDLDNILDDEITFNNDQRDRYREIVKKGYQELTYEIKDEKVNGNTAEVEVEIEVIDYSNIITESEDYLNQNPNEFNDKEGNYDVSLFTDYRLDLLEKNKEKVEYTITFNLTKENNKWTIDQLSEDDINKINGTYNH